jgi:hypothetical protein
VDEGEGSDTVSEKVQESVATPGVQSGTGQVPTEEKNPLNKHHPDWVRHALWCIKEADFLQVAQAFTYLVETSNDWEDLKDDPMLLLLADRIHRWFLDKPSRDLVSMFYRPEACIVINREECGKKVDEWLRGKKNP